MVLTMELEQQTTTQGQICDSQHRPSSLIQNHQHSIDIQIPTTKTSSSVDVELAKRTMKLDLNKTTATSAIATTNRQKSKDGDDKGVKSPKSPLSNSGRTTGVRLVTHQSSITSQIDVDNDRKALRDALYQGIFSRHRRTIFAFGSFLRMLRRNSQYNTIRSSSEGEDDTR